MATGCRPVRPLVAMTRGPGVPKRPTQAPAAAPPRPGRPARGGIAACGALAAQRADGAGGMAAAGVSRVRRIDPWPCPARLARAGPAVDGRGFLPQGGPAGPSHPRASARSCCRLSGHPAEFVAHTDSGPPACGPLRAPPARWQPERSSFIWCLQDRPETALLVPVRLGTALRISARPHWPRSGQHRSARSVRPAPLGPLGPAQSRSLDEGSNRQDGPGPCRA